MLYITLCIVFYVAGVILFIQKGRAPIVNKWSNAGRVWAQAGWVMFGVLPISLYRYDMVAQIKINEIIAIIYLVTFALAVPFLFIKALGESE